MLPVLAGAVHVTLTLELVGSKAVTPIGTEGTMKETYHHNIIVMVYTVMNHEYEQECIKPAKPAREHAITYTHNVNGKIQTWRMVVY